MLRRNGVLQNTMAKRSGLAERVAAAVDRELLAGIVLVLLVTALGVALTMQGWRSRIPAFDLLTYIHSGREFLASGVLPQYGDTGSYGSFGPVGTAWLMMPSMLLFDDPRLSEYAGTAMLHLATLLGILFLGRHYFNKWCAYLAVILYGLSHHGLFLAGSLWPNGRPDFYVWVALFVTLWVSRNDAKFLAAAAAVWAIGMQVDMGIAPAIFIFPTVWIYYRPPIRLRPLLVGAVLALLVWMPYLRFEASRGFSDIRSQLLLQNIFPARDYKAAWCDPGRTLLSLPSADDSVSGADLAVSEASMSAVSALRGLGAGLEQKLQSNFFASAPIRGAAAILFLFTLTGILFLSTKREGDRAWLFIPHWLWGRWLVVGATGLILAGLLFNEVLVARYLSPDGVLGAATVSRIRLIQTAVLLGGTLILLEKPLARLADHVLERSGREHGAVQGRRIALLALCLGVPWLLLLIVAEPGKPERFWWLWPIQILFLAAFVTVLLPLLRARIWLVGIVLVAVASVIVVNPFMRWRVTSWMEDGWSGPDADQIRVVEYISDRLNMSGQDRAAIGYQTFIYPFMARYHTLNPEYKVGAEFDLLFSYRHNVTNTNQCAEGLSQDDDYRIRQLQREPDPAAPRHYFDRTVGENYRFLQRIGNYEVYIRD